MLAENKRFLDHSGITKFHEAGYAGKNTLFASAERFSVPDVSALGFKAIAPLANYPSGIGDSHSIMTASAFFTVAPEATLAILPHCRSVMTENGVQKIVDFIPDTIDTIKRLGVLGMFASFEDSSTGSVSQMDAALDKLSYFFYVVSAGNQSEISCNPAMYAKNVYGIGAYYNTSNGAISTPYSSVCADVDWAAPVNFTVRTPTGTTEATGTSSAAPYFLGMVALIQDFFISNVGRPLTKSEMYKFLLKHSVDFFTPGKDSKTGNGYVVLPDPKTINPNEWVEPMKIEMKIGSKTAYVNGKALTIDQAPFVDPVSGRTLVPLRFVAEALGCTVTWEQEHPLDILITR